LGAPIPERVTEQFGQRFRIQSDGNTARTVGGKFFFFEEKVMSQNVFFTADEHYGHANIIKFCKRPFAHVDEMRETLIANHNSRVQKCDLTYHLGDMFWRHVSLSQATDILKRLNGKHFLIWGNHDETAEKVMKQCYGAPKFEWAKDVKLIKPRAQYPSIWMSHYAHRVWPDSHKGSYHVYGHTHAVLPDYRRSCDVGVDNWDYAPVSLETLDTWMRNKVVKPDEVELDMEKNKWDKTGN
jgi:calcineurin-like phosphoesterase family protein